MAHPAAQAKGLMRSQSYSGANDEERLTSEVNSEFYMKPWILCSKPFNLIKYSTMAAAIKSWNQVRMNCKSPKKRQNNLTYCSCMNLVFLLSLWSWLKLIRAVLHCTLDTLPVCEVAPLQLEQNCIPQRFCSKWRGIKFTEITSWGKK